MVFYFNPVFLGLISKTEIIWAKKFEFLFVYIDLIVCVCILSGEFYA